MSLAVTFAPTAITHIHPTRTMPIPTRLMPLRTTNCISTRTPNGAVAPLAPAADPAVTFPRAVTSRRGTVERAWLAACAGMLVAVALVSRPSAETFELDESAEVGFGVDTASAMHSVHGAAAGMASMIPGAVQQAPAAVGPAPAVGWFATYSGTDTARKALEVKAHADNAAFFLAPGETLHPTLAAANVSATFTGVVPIADSGTYSFAVEAEGGAATLTVYDAALNQLGAAKRDLAPGSGREATRGIALKPGDITLSVTFKRGADRPARLRVLWSRARSGDDPGFVIEPLPSAFVRVPSHGRTHADDSLASFRGRVLIGQAGCMNCHAATDAEKSAVNYAPGPLLGDAGARFSPQWLADWIVRPQQMKPGCNMPNVLGDDGAGKAVAEDIVHFLVSRGGPFKAEPLATEKSVLDAGRQLFHSVGCVACHGALEPAAVAFADDALPKEMPTAAPLISYGQLAGKWRPSALAEFLQDPTAHRPSGRMPSLNLTKEEADLIATYVLTKLGPARDDAFKPDAARADRGREAFAARGCASCHAMTATGGNIASTMKGKPFAALLSGPGGKSAGAAGKPVRADGCLSPTDAATPRYTFSDADRAAITAAVAEINRATGAFAPVDFAHRTLETLNCRACHEYEGVGGVKSPHGAAVKEYFRLAEEAELGDEGRLPPVLTGVGWKLTSAWMRQVFTEAGRARPYMATRMPQFGAANMARMPAALASCSGVRPDTDGPEPKSTDELTAAGRALTGDQGLNCISCHVFGRFPPAGTPGPSISDFAERLRFEWWKTYVMDPTRFKPGTRMPLFYITGKGQLDKILGGDPGKQIDAMWSYFALGFAAPPPDGLKAAGGIMLSAKDRPIVVRTFLKDAGSRAIAVGYPSGPHFAFDASSARLIAVWTGEFLDASGAWAGRGGNVTGGRGRNIWQAPEGASWLLLTADAPVPSATDASAPPRSSFKGYELDAAGIPTFRSTLEPGAGQPAGVVAIAERIVPGKREGFPIRLELTVSGLESRRLLMNLGDAVAEPITENGAAAVLPGPSARLEIRAAGAAPVRVIIDLAPSAPK